MSYKIPQHTKKLNGNSRKIFQNKEKIFMKSLVPRIGNKPTKMSHSAAGSRFVITHVKQLDDDFSKIYPKIVKKFCARMDGRILNK